MVNCPKCRFSQPADQYCASCGVDMKTWRPKQKPLLVRVATNPIFQISLVVVIVGGGYSFMRKSKESELAARVRAIEIARQAEEFDQGISEAQAPRPRVTNAASTGNRLAAQQAFAASAPAEPQQAQAQPQANAKPFGAAALNNDQLANVNRSRSGDGSTASAAPGASANAPTNATIAYYEMSVALATNLLQSATQTISDGPLSMGVVLGIEGRLKNQTLRSLETASHALQVNTPGVIYKGALDQTTGAKLGFTLEMNTIASDDNGAQIQFELTRVLREASPSGFEEARFQPGDAFLVPKGAALVIAGLLPRKTQTEADATFYKGVAVLRPLTSSAFMGGQSEVVLVIEAK